MLSKIKDGVRQLIARLARIIDSASRGKITPNLITLLGVLGHLIIAWAIIDGSLVVAGLLLIFFGLFDTLDGELARLQKRAGPAGMFLDSATDRIKEAMLYVAITIFLVNQASEALIIAVTVIALAVSLITSYLNAWGEVTLQGRKAASHKTNSTLRSGLLGFELRMALLVLGLLSGQIVPSLFLIATLGAITVGQRLSNTLKLLK
jgi:CDP-diacylglycerol---glycerol-3-phosphate 3-phosphatidyltransferase